MRPDPRLPNTQDHCRATYRLRVRARDAEAEVVAAHAETEAVRAEMRALRAEIRAERAALIAFIESPEWHRDLLTLARARVRAELVALSTQRKSCAACGSFGRGLYEDLLRAEIDTINTEHRLPPDHALAPINWPVRMGSHTRRGRALREDWLSPPQARKRTARKDAW
ncbi:hypothetical protein [Algimonas arctica]|nr:hypothetical protein [Algimonas arctica]